MAPSVIATNIETEQFYGIIKLLKSSGWKLVAEYSHHLYDKGIDFYFYQFIKDTRAILLSWNNWTEGEMKTTEATIHEIALQTGIQFQYGDPEYLHQDDIMKQMHPMLKYY